MTTYVVRMKLNAPSPKHPNDGMIVLIKAETPEEAVAQAEEAWSYEALSVGLLPVMGSRQHSVTGKHLRPVTRKQVTTTTYEVKGALV